MKMQNHPLIIPKSSESGYTLLEGLMAVIVVSVVLVGIGPVVAFSVGTRVQAKRVELATQAGRTYIDGVKSGSIPIDINSGATKIESVIYSQTNDKPEKFTVTVTAPKIGSFTCEPTSANPYCTVGGKTLYCVDFDGDNQCSSSSVVDMMVQPFRSALSTADDFRKSYLLGIRVYRANSFADEVGQQYNTSQLDTTLPATTVTNALGDRRKPLVKMTTEVVPSTSNFNDLQKRLEKTSP